MKPACAIAIVLCGAAALWADQPSAAQPELRSMHGTMITMVGDAEGMPFEIWAKGDNARSELVMGDEKLVVLQLDDTIYTFGSGSQQGNRTRFEAGLASHGLLQQIAIIRARGKQGKSQQVDGVVYDEYTYDADAPREVTRALLERKTSLPKDWISIVKIDASEPVAARTVFRDLEADVDVPDSLFSLPPGVQFKDVAAAELMATPLPSGAPLTAPAPKLTSLHGTLVINEQEDKPLEIWARGDTVRAESSAGKRKTINLQLGDTIYTYAEGSTTGTRKRVESKLRSLALVPRIEKVLAHGKKVESLTIEGVLHDKYTYDLDSPTETCVVYLRRETSLPGLWIYTMHAEGTKGVIVEQFRDLQANPDIPNDLFQLPSGVRFSEPEAGGPMRPADSSGRP